MKVEIRHYPLTKPAIAVHTRYHPAGDSVKRTAFATTPGLRLPSQPYRSGLPLPLGR